FCSGWPPLRSSPLKSEKVSFERKKCQSLRTSEKRGLPRKNPSRTGSGTNRDGPAVSDARTRSDIREAYLGAASHHFLPRTPGSVRLDHDLCPVLRVAYAEFPIRSVI